MMKPVTWAPAGPKDQKQKAAAGQSSKPQVPGPPANSDAPGDDDHAALSKLDLVTAALRAASRAHSDHAVEIERLSATVDAQRAQLQTTNAQLARVQAENRELVDKLVQQSPATRDVKRLLDKRLREVEMLQEKLAEVSSQRDALMVTKQALTAQVSELMRCSADQASTEADAAKHRELCERLSTQLAGMCGMIGISAAESPEETAAAVSAWVEQALQQQEEQQHELEGWQQMLVNADLAREELEQEMQTLMAQTQGQATRLEQMLIEQLEAAADKNNTLCSSPVGKELDQQATSTLIWEEAPVAAAAKKLRQSLEVLPGLGSGLSPLGLPTSSMERFSHTPVVSEDARLGGGKSSEDCHSEDSHSSHSVDGSVGTRFGSHLYTKPAGSKPGGGNADASLTGRDAAPTAERPVPERDQQPQQQAVLGAVAAAADAYGSLPSTPSTVHAPCISSPLSDQSLSAFTGGIASAITPRRLLASPFGSPPPAAAAAAAAAMGSVTSKAHPAAAESLSPTPSMTEPLAFARHILGAVTPPPSLHAGASAGAPGALATDAADAAPLTPSSVVASISRATASIVALVRQLGTPPPVAVGELGLEAAGQLMNADSAFRLDLHTLWGHEQVPEDAGQQQQQQQQQQLGEEDEEGHEQKASFGAVGDAASVYVEAGQQEQELEALDAVMATLAADELLPDCANSTSPAAQPAAAAAQERVLQSHPLATVTPVQRRRRKAASSRHTNADQAPAYAPLPVVRDTPVQPQRTSREQRLAASAAAARAAARRRRRTRTKRALIGITVALSALGAVAGAGVAWHRHQPQQAERMLAIAGVRARQGQHWAGVLGSKAWRAARGRCGEAWERVAPKCAAVWGRVSPSCAAAWGKVAPGCGAALLHVARGARVVRTGVRQGVQQAGGRVQQVRKRVGQLRSRQQHAAEGGEAISGAPAAISPEEQQNLVDGDGQAGSGVEVEGAGEGVEVVVLEEPTAAVMAAVAGKDGDA